MSSAATEILRRQQDAGKRVEQRMLETLLTFTPLEELRVGDVKYIALTARNLAFEAMQEVAADPF